MKSIIQKSISLDLKTLIQDKINQGVPESVFASAPDLARQLDEARAALRCVVNSGPLNNGLRDENTMSVARTALARAEKGAQS